ncbi:hypothetical protein HJG60_010097 [Phyllostomus discolor]|uniref:Uncharacterized protein n=1 Tax=Phyllostomus discolor TaxID=89673 RepID=A0A834AW54_9CHIR|nr:hypothetical protein HJG60_010097 [Phyllostomus discolor]
MAPAPLSLGLQSPLPLPTSKLEPCGAGSWAGGFVYFLGLCEFPQRVSCEAERTSRPQLPQVFSVSAFRLCFLVLGPWVVRSVSLPFFHFVCLCANMWLQIASCLACLTGSARCFLRPGSATGPSAAPVLLGSSNCHLCPAHPCLPATAFSCRYLSTPLHRPPTLPLLTGLDVWESDFHSVHFSVFWLFFCL